MSLLDGILNSAAGPPGEDGAPGPPGTSAAIDPVDFATAVNISLSGLSALQGITPTTLMRVLVGGQTLARNNGIYTPQAGAWIRTADFDTTADFTAVAARSFIKVRGGDFAGATGFIDVSDTFVLGTDDVTVEITPPTLEGVHGQILTIDTSTGIPLPKAVDVDDIVVGSAKAVIALITPVTHSGTFTYHGRSVVADEVVLDVSGVAADAGLWVVKAGAWVRPTDVTVAPGLVVAVLEGSAAGSQWQMNAALPFLLDTTAQAWNRTDGGMQRRTADTASTVGVTIADIDVPQGVSWFAEFDVLITRSGVSPDTQKFSISGTTSTGGVTTNFVQSLIAMSGAELGIVEAGILAGAKIRLTAYAGAATATAFAVSNFVLGIK